MANTMVNGRAYKITTADHNNTLVLGDCGQGVVGAWAVHFVNDNTFLGTIIVQNRIRGADAAAANVPFVPCVFRKDYLNGAVGDGTLASTTITTTSLIVVPSFAMALGLAITCTGGSGTLYTWPLEGSPSF